MPSYIELDKQQSFPASSNTGKSILGINSSGQATLTDSNGNTTTIGGGLPYSTYTTKVRHDDDYGDDIGNGGTLTVGQTYSIITGGDGDFSNIANVLAGVVNRVNCIFIATGTTPNSWGSSVVRSYGNPIVDSIQLNELGPDTSGSWSRVNAGSYAFNFPVSVDPRKVAASFTPSSYKTMFSYIDTTSYKSNSVTNFTSSLGSGFNARVYTTAISVSGSILLGGEFTTFNSSNTYRMLVRLYSDGNIDRSFTDNLNSQGGFGDGRVYILKVQPDGKILVGGGFKGVNGNSSKQHLIRLNSDGTEDTTFYTNLSSTGDGSGFSDPILDIELQSDGKIIVVGRFTKLNNNVRTGIVRLNADGTEDTTFYNNVTSTGDNSGFTGGPIVTNVTVQSDNKVIILVTGDYVFNGIRYNTSIFRFNSNGSFDNTYYNNFISTGDNSGEDRNILTIALQNDDKLLIGGDFSTINGISYHRLARVNVDGTVDTSYISQIEGDNVTSIIVTGPDNITYVGGGIGGFQNYGSVSNVIKVTQDTQLLNSFGNVSSSVAKPLSLLPLPYNKLLVTTYENTGGYVHEIFTGIDVFYNLNTYDNQGGSDGFNPVQFEIRKYN